VHFFPDQTVLEAGACSCHQRRRQTVCAKNRNLLRCRQVHTFEAHTCEHFAPLLKRQRRVSPDGCHYALFQTNTPRRAGLSLCRFRRARCNERRCGHSGQELSPFHATHYTMLSMLGFPSIRCRTLLAVMQGGTIPMSQWKKKCVIISMHFRGNASPPEAIVVSYLSFRAFKRSTKIHGLTSRAYRDAEDTWRLIVVI